jgi:hypothetical protein
LAISAIGSARKDAAMASEVKRSRVLDLIFAIDEDRKTPRRRTLKAAKIVHYRGETIDCVVRDLSATGACLVIESKIDVASRFCLLFESDKTTKHCQVVWRSGNKMGVAFD